MDTVLYHFFVDLLLLLRILAAVLWGSAWAAYLTWTEHGRYLAKERTWITVVAGVGVDLIIAYGGDWWTVIFVIAASSPPIIARSLYQERLQEAKQVNYNANHLKWGVEDATATTGDLIKSLSGTLADFEASRAVRDIARALSLALQVQEILILARSGAKRAKN